MLLQICQSKGANREVLIIDFEWTMMKKILKNVLFFHAILVGGIYAPLVLLLNSITRGTIALTPLQFFTSDTFYYLSIARHSAGRAFYTADGLYPTNGFHPLWGFLLKALFEVPAVAGDYDVQILLVFGLSIALVTMGTVLFGFVVYKITRNFAVSLLASIPGFYYLIFSAVAPNYNSVWSFANGMETPLSIFLFSLLLYLLINKRGLRKPAIPVVIFMALIMTLIIFARLDDLFLLFPYLAMVYFFADTKRDAAIRLGISAGIPAIAILVYLFHNYSYAGSFLPVSGMIKQGNWFIINLAFFIFSFIPMGLIDTIVLWSETSMRALQMCIPVILALPWFFHWIRALKKGVWKSQIKNHYIKTVITALLAYVIMKGLYNLVFVYIMGQGHWYFSINIMVFNLTLAILLAKFLENMPAQKIRIPFNVISVLLVLLYANAFVNYKEVCKYNSSYYDFWIQGKTINRELLKIDSNMKIVEYDDGIMSYLLDPPTMNGFGFTLDREAYKAQYTGRLLELAYKRGFRVIGVMSYMELPANIDNDSDQIRKLLQDMPGIKLENLDLWKFKILYRAPNTDAVFIEFDKK